jgi:hypothetical protein
VFPIAKVALSLLEISDYWSREIRPSALPNELLSMLVSAWWLGEFRGDFRHSPLQLLKIMYTSTFRDDLGIVFIVGGGKGPSPVVLPDGSWEIDVRPQIHVPSSNIESWDEAGCRDAFHALAELTERSSIESYRHFAVLLPSTKLTYEQFNTWRRMRGYPKPKFWGPRHNKPKSSPRLQPDPSHRVGKGEDLTRAPKKGGRPPTAHRGAPKNAATRQPQQERARRVLQALFGSEVPDAAVLPNKHLAAQVNKWLEERKQPPVGQRTIQRAAGRK